MTRRGLWAVVPAAGVGRRLGGSVAKQYRQLLDRTVIEHSLAPLLRVASIRRVIVALAADDSQWPALAVADEPRVRCVEGGERRCDSVRMGLQALHTEAHADDWVLVHDAARPCLHDDDLAVLIESACASEAGGLLAVPVSDTLKRGNGQVEQTIDRARLWRALTPQMFPLGQLLDALDAAIEAGFEPGDEAQAMEHAGYRPRLVRGRADNIKVTEADDLELAAAILAHRRASPVHS